MSSQLPAVIIPAFIPSPSQGVWHLGPLPLRAYAICILLGIFAGYWLGRRRWVARGGSAEVLADVIMWAVPFGLVGARIYHVITDAELYFGEGKHPIDALKIWHGGLGIWGAVAFGALGAWIACRRHKVPFLAVADAMAPGIALAQVIGRFGNYFNQELFGKPTNVWWALEIDPAHRPDGYQDFGTFHPTFLYEAIWNLGVIALVILAGRRFKLGHGRAFALYVAGYTAGRAWIENLRIDTVNEFAGLRLNVWTSIILFILAVAFFILSARLKPGQEDISTTPAAKPDAAAADESDAAASDADDSDAAAADKADAAADDPAAAAAARSDATTADDSRSDATARSDAATADDPAAAAAARSDASDRSDATTAGESDAAAAGEKSATGVAPTSPPAEGKPAADSAPQPTDAPDAPRTSGDTTPGDSAPGNSAPGDSGAGETKADLRLDATDGPRD